ncbi:MAG: molybdopterin-synthase adenylyltransferase MoeB [Armatimonadota bacterium]|nr:MAG: molybdopterin-synthase adenylyltransferase MoeB [Armatimonadota bacterium]
MALTEHQGRRYARHVSLPEVGEAGQERLLRARVLVVGAGGLGSPAVAYLAAAGVGAIGVADGEVVELSNLQRQIIHATSELACPKTQSAARRLHDLNPEVRVIPHEDRLSARNLPGIIQDYDFILDCTDNIASRYLLNDACVLTGKPLSHAAVARFEGQITTIVPGRGPCYRCLYPEPPAPGAVPDAAQAGIFNIAPAVIGAMQAAETMKWILGAGELLVGRLVVYDALTASFCEVLVERDPNCAVCGSEPTITQLRDIR